MSEATAFELQGVVKRYGPKTGLGPLSISIPSGQKVALVGPSGSGKTTLLNLLAQSVISDEGQISIYGRPLATLRDRRSRSALVGMMHQQLDLVPNLAVVHNVLAGRLGRWGLMRSALSLALPQDLGPALTALERAGIGEKLYERTSHLSGGEQQRVALARLLVQDPRALLVDEPVSALDPARADDLVRLLITIADEDDRTIVASLHAVPLALAYFDRIIALREGCIAFDRPSSEVQPSDLKALYGLAESSAQTEKIRPIAPHGPSGPPEVQ